MRARRAASPAAEPDHLATPASARAALAASAARGGRPHDAAGRAARTAAALAHLEAGFARPWWLARQTNAAHGAFVPAGDLVGIENLTGRSWVTLATVGSGPLGVVDPGGAVQPAGADWSIDWAIGAEDRWHHPASEPTVRQRVVSLAPVVETVCKVPSGDAVSRAYAITTASGEAIVIEIENESPVPFVALFALRPTHPLGVGAITSVAYEHPHVLVDERPVLVFEKRVARWSAADAPHDALAMACSGEARDDAFEPVRSTVGLATATFLLPVPHRTSVRVICYPHAARRDRPAPVVTVPAAGQVARGWEAHVARAARIDLPDRRVSDAYGAALRSLAAASTEAFRVPLGRDISVADETAIVASLAGIGLRDLAARVVRRRGDEQELDSWFRREPSSIERNIDVFAAVGALWSAGRDAGALEDVIGPVVKAAHWTERARARAASLTVDTARAAETALRSLAAAVRGCDQPDAADDLEAFAARFVLDIDEPDPATVPVSPAAVPAAADEPVRAAAVETLRGLDTVATLREALADVRRRDPFVFDRVEWLLRVAGPTLRWPTRVHPRLLTGCGGSGDDPVAAALMVALVRALVVEEDTRANTLVLLPVVPPTWYGQSVDVHDLPTAHGRLSFALRWHATRPALLWELEPHDPAAAPVTLTAPGLDAAWSTTAAQGEALLAAPPQAERVAVVAQPSSDHVPMTTFEPRIRRERDGDPPVVSGAVPAPPPVEPGESFG